MTTRTLNRLTAAKVATTRGPSMMADGGRLYLRVGDNGNRRWLFIYARAGRQHEVSIGPWPALSLADARKERDRLNAQLAKGEMPGLRKDQATFRSVAEEVIKRRSSSWRGGVSAWHWKISIEKHCAPLLDRPIAGIGLEDVLHVLAPLCDQRPAFAPITRSRIEDVFNFAAARGLIPADKPNPADHKRLKLLLPSPPKPTHRAALPYGAVPRLVGELRAIPHSDPRFVAARALETTILTALRVGEVCNAHWSEFDLEKKLFTIPENRMKTGREHQVPLSPRVVQILGEMEPLLGKNGVVFPAQRGTGPIDGDRLWKLIRQLRPGVTTHGCRSSFRDWCGDETNFAREVAEAALAHVVGGVEGSYRRGSALEKRRALMAAWSGFCGGEKQSGKVIALRSGA
jgi:integrase